MTMGLMSDCSSYKNNGADVCEAIDNDWCCLYMKSEMNDVAVDMWACCYNPSKVNMDDMDLDVDMSHITEHYCANSVLLRLTLAAVAMALALLF
eukprot:CAMPEP_0170540120 /NCGR_PEP_ID=MMETSP0211-20121228/156_1 /TAXON_ID=311385 /ORGANISM="Pseudokeronopsis sp., Strain OXSARD2" /LENGTH=93 /DNA_ID=CAMNT_0010842407 /DNA_START=120 /DNA_END=401 /DNA_ORIENTATION=-